MPEQADGQRHRKRYERCKEGPLVFETDREVPFTNNESKRALRWSVIFRKVTKATRPSWGGALFGGRSGIGGLNCQSPLEAIVPTLDRQSILKPA